MFKKVKYLIRDYFGFSRMETNGTLVLALLIIIALVSPYLWEHLYPTGYDNYANDQKRLDSLMHIMEESVQMAVVKVPSNKSSYSGKSNDKPNRKYETKKKSYQIKKFDLNTADTTQFKSIYGIGPVLSARIIKYRNLLGGFVNTDQLKEVYGLKPEVIENLLKKGFITKDFIPEQVNINTEKAFELYRHPYISKKMAYSIIDLNKKQDQLSSDLLQKHFKLADSVVVKLIPYIKFK